MFRRLDEQGVALVALEEVFDADAVAATPAATLVGGDDA